VLVDEGPPLFVYVPFVVEFPYVPVPLAVYEAVVVVLFDE
jgi:hypothetical protein